MNMKIYIDMIDFVQGRCTTTTKFKYNKDQILYKQNM